MGWADGHVARLTRGETVSFRPRGNSMVGKIDSGDLCTVAPLGDHVLALGDIVLCRVKGNQYLHLVKAIRADRTRSATTGAASTAGSAAPRSTGDWYGWSGRAVSGTDRVRWYDGGVGRRSFDHPVLGHMEPERTFGGYVSEEKVVGALAGHRCRFVLLDYDEDPDPRQFDAAIRAALAGEDDVLEEARPHLLEYFEDMERLWKREKQPTPLDDPSEIWGLVEFGKHLMVSRRAEGDEEDGIYLSLECECEWEPEHGLELVLRDGRRITKLGPYDGHVTNADASGDSSLVGVVYDRIGR